MSELMYLDCPICFFSKGGPTFSQEARQEFRERSLEQYQELLLINKDELQSVLETGIGMDKIRYMVPRLISIVDKEMGPGLMTLRKEWDMDLLDFLSKTLQTPELFGEQRAYVYGRTMIHFVRLVDPKLYHGDFIPSVTGSKDGFNNLSVEFGQSFVKDYLLYVSTLENSSIDDTERFHYTIGLEGEGTVFFWSTAQYVYSGLQTLGLDAKEAMITIFNWVRSAHKEGDKYNDIYSLYKNNFKGAEVFVKAGIWSIDKALGFDERCPSHLLYRLLSLEIAKILIDEN